LFIFPNLAKTKRKKKCTWFFLKGAMKKNPFLSKSVKIKNQYVLQFLINIFFQDYCFFQVKP